MMPLVTSSREESALGAAQERFVDALPRRIAELSALHARFVSGPAHGTSGAERAELLRRLGALQGSARVFRLEELATRLDALAAALRGPTGDDDAEPSESAAPDPVDVETAFAALRASVGLGEDSESSADAEAALDAAPTWVGLATDEAKRASAGSGADDGAPTPLRTVVPTPRVASAPATPQSGILSLLVVGESALRLSRGLPAERFEMIPVTPGDASEAARVSVPDVVLVSQDVIVREGPSFIAALRADASTDLVPIVLVAPENTPLPSARAWGADDVVPADADASALAEKLARLSGALPSGRPPELGTMTLREVADRMAEEIRRGLVDAAERGADEELSLGDGTDLFAAVWASIARMRATVVERSSGRVRFHDSDRRGSRSWLTVGTAQTSAPAPVEVALEGRRILVADDDAAVRWFFQGLLEDAGAEVLEAPDGRAALEIARRTSPDLVITDILMPRLDGLSLSRELSRDPLLADTPVIFLSWKEDFLQRMRELRAGASAYLRKEEGASVILDRVREALRPRARFEARLREPGEVRGRVEGLGVMSIVRSVGRLRRDATVSVRDVYNLFEVEVRGGRIAGVLRTATDGSFARGEAALGPLLGVTAGRFAVKPPASHDKPTLSPIASEQIERAAARLGALVDAVSGRRIATADAVVLDAEVVASLLRISPPPIVDVVERLRLDPSARRWLASGDIEPEVLESALVELARRGAVRAVRGERGEDRVEEALSARRGTSVPPAAPAATATDEPAEPEAMTTERPGPSGRVTRNLRKRREGPDETLRIERDPAPPPSAGPGVGTWVILGVTLIAGAMIALGFLAARTPAEATAPEAAPMPVDAPIRSR